MKKLTSILFSAIFVTQFSFAQTKETASLQQIWYAYFNQTRFTSKLGIWIDLHLRTKEDFFSNFSQAIYRFGLTYYLNDVTKITAGYAYVNLFPGDTHKQISQPEHRPWQQLQWLTRYGKKRVMQWLRLEERYRRNILNDSTLADGYAFNFRTRYNFMIQVPLNNRGITSHTFSFIANDEIHVNFGKQVVYNYFDQNRFFVGFGYQTTNADHLQLGYMNIFQQLPAGNKYRSIHAVRIFYFHNIDLRKI